MTYTFPWPPTLCNPNSRAHWAKKNHAAQKYKWNCAMLALSQKMPKQKSPLNVKLTFKVPDNRRRDDDNMIRSFKAGRDAIAGHIGVDDHYWTVTYKVDREPIKNGAVYVEFEGGAS